jgi:hypothetical protein
MTDIDDKNQELIYASMKGLAAVVNLLLQDPRVDPSVRDNEAIIYASKYDNSAVVALLLQDPRVDPSAQNNCAIRWTSIYGYLAIFNMLIHDPRVDVHTLDPCDVHFLSIERILSMDLALPFPADSMIKHLESSIREQRQEFIDIIDERTVYNNTDTHGIHREVWKYVVSPYLE